MKAQTLTTIGKLQPGDVFCTECSNTQLIKIAADPVRHSKHLYQCQAIPVEGIEPKKFKGEKPVIFLYKAPDLLTEKINSNEVLHPASNIK